MLSSGVDTGWGNTSKKKKCPSRGKRYSKAQKEEILKFAQANSVEEASVKFNATGSSIYEWRRSLKRRGGGDGTAEGEIKIEDPAENRDQKVIMMWRQHPGFGPSQIRNRRGLHRRAAG